MKEKLFYSVTSVIFIIIFMIITQLILFNKIDIATLIGAVIGISFVMLIELSNDKYDKDKYNMFTRKNLIFFSLYFISLILVRLFLSYEYRIYPIIILLVILITYEFIKRRKKKKLEN
ncbi:hypothetical protein ACLIJS_13910 [Mammaliicoccus sciuri]|uniref:hypothetical protein n=1 Tax=Mammaliicoccus sciuri TaxID=1296 RepID=UPI003A94366A